MDGPSSLIPSGVCKFGPACKFGKKCTNGTHPAPDAKVCRFGLACKFFPLGTCTNGSHPTSDALSASKVCRFGSACKFFPLGTCTNGSHPVLAAAAPISIPVCKQAALTNAKQDVPVVAAALIPVGKQAAPAAVPAGKEAAPCKFGSGCTRPDCYFGHPERLAAPAAAAPAAHIPGDFIPQTNWRVVAQGWFELLMKGDCEVCPACLGTPPKDGKICMCCGVTADFCEECTLTFKGQVCFSCTEEFHNPKYAEFVVIMDDTDDEDDADLAKHLDAAPDHFFN